MPKKTSAPRVVTFTSRGAFYGCSEPGDQAGEYVRLEDYKKLQQAMQQLNDDCSAAYDEVGRHYDALESAVKKHRREKWGTSPVYKNGVPDPEDETLYRAAGINPKEFVR